MTKRKATECIGMTLHGWTVYLQTLNAAGTLPYASPHWSYQDIAEHLKTMKSIGMLKECSVHPGYLISGTWGKKRD